MNFNQLLEKSQNDDTEYRIKLLRQRTSQSLASIVVNSYSDIRDVTAAKRILKQRGVEGVPE